MVNRVRNTCTIALSGEGRNLHSGEGRETNTASTQI